MKRLLFLALVALLCLGVGSVLSYGSSDDTWTDSTSGLMWQVSPTGGEMGWSAAKSHCESLSLAGYSDWRLPTINELRSLIRGCPVTQKGGACGVTDSCLKFSCLNEGCVKACSIQGGPGSGGAYWPPELSGDIGWYWSSSLTAQLAGFAWGVNLYAGIDGHALNIDDKVRCVRN